MIKAFIYSTDGEIEKLSTIRTYASSEAFDRAREEISLYDDGASHTLIRLDACLKANHEINMLQNTLKMREH